MSEPLTIIVLGEPVGKGRPRFVRKTGHAFTPEKTRAYEDVLRLAAQSEMARREIMDGALAVSVLAKFPVPASWSAKKKERALNGLIRPTKKPDSDNILKLLDALNNLVWRDDAQIVEATIKKVYSAKPALVVKVLPLALTEESEAAA